MQIGSDVDYPQCVLFCLFATQSHIKIVTANIGLHAYGWVFFSWPTLFFIDLLPYCVENTIILALKY